MVVFFTYDVARKFATVDAELGVVAAEVSTVNVRLEFVMADVGSEIVTVDVVTVDVRSGFVTLVVGSEFVTEDFWFKLVTTDIRPDVLKGCAVRSNEV